MNGLGLPIFFNAIRRDPFGGKLSQKQVNGCNAILYRWQQDSEKLDAAPLAYIFATVYWETDRTMQPIEEYGRGRGRQYGKPVNGIVYYGRGWVQLTWLPNYRKAQEALGIPLVAHPELMLTESVSADVTFWGMQLGKFTGRKLSDYFDAEGRKDWVNARRIINGLDHAKDIARIAQAFYSALIEAREGIAA